MSESAVKIDDDYQLSDIYTRRDGRVFLTGIQALVRLALVQHRQDAEAGLDTAGFISGYRGSPLGGYDQELNRAGKYLEEERILFKPAVNEELAATMVLGSQRACVGPAPKHDGVFGIWYGKGPGLDRAGDALKHGNAFGSAPKGGVLVLAGDDHAAESSSMGHQSEQAMIAWHMPVVNPADVSEYVEYGLYGLALSRFSGCWTGFKAISETVESGRTVDLSRENLHLTLPDESDLPQGDRHVRLDDKFKEIEPRLLGLKIPAVKAFIRANPLDKLAFGARKPRFMIVTAGKAHHDVLQALADVGLDETKAATLGIGVYKIGVTWPMDGARLRDFAEGAETLFVVEEKGPVVEAQVKDALYHLPADRRPRVLGKTDETGEALLPEVGEMSPAMILEAMAPALRRLGSLPELDMQLALLAEKKREEAEEAGGPIRVPYYCSGCPHNTSTRVPEGSRAGGGIGCHYMATWIYPQTSICSQMGGEGVDWAGEAPFTDQTHIFQNLGDGTYYHSGLMAIRQAISMGTNITYKILFNDAVAMTGGQDVDGPLTVPQITRQVRAEGVETIIVVTDEPEKYPRDANFADGVTIHHRDELNDIQRELREIPGVTVLVYDQTCAAEKRRRRKRGQFPNPQKRVFINDLVCEECGDCSVQSNCVSIVPKNTDFGRKRAIDQSSCNKDYSCLKGFCPSFVTVEGYTRASAETNMDDSVEKALAEVPPVPLPPLTRPVSLLAAGIGGTGVTTLAHILATAAMLEGKASSVLDFTGLAQKNGAVMSYIRIGEDEDSLGPVRIGTAQADVLLACDLVTATSPDAIATLNRERTRVFANTHAVQTAEFVKDRDADIGVSRMIERLKTLLGKDRVDSLEATAIAVSLLGDSIGANLFLLGYAWQQGTVPVSRDALNRAIELNGVAIEMNKQALALGRLAAHDLDRLEDLLPRAVEDPTRTQDLAEIVNRRVEELTGYQNEAYARRYRSLVDQVRRIEERLGAGTDDLSRAVARNYYKVLAVKDEYEVARLFTDGRFREKLGYDFADAGKIKYHFAPPLFARTDPRTGRPKKIAMGAWATPLLKLLAKMKVLRGTPLDIFGLLAERRAERRLIGEYEDVVAEIMQGVNRDNYDIAVALAELPADIRGFGPVKEAAMKDAKKREERLLEEFRTAERTPEAA